MKIRASVYFLIFIILFTAYVMATSLTFRYTEDKQLIIFAGSLILILVLVELPRELRTQGRTQKGVVDQAGQAIDPGMVRRRIISGLAWLAAYIAGVYLLGFNVASIIFIISYSMLHKVGWFKAISIATITIASTYVLFELGLKIAPYRGVLLSWL